MGFFDLFKRGSRPPRCPVTPDDRLWIENSFAWFDEQFGGRILRSGPVVLPDSSCFPAPYSPDAEGVNDLLERVCDWMDVDRGSILLDIYDSGEDRFPGMAGGPSEGAAGHMVWDDVIRCWVIGVAAKMLPDPMAVVAVLAHELSHVHLFGFGRVDPREEDHEPLTDLLAIYYGFGVFQGNAAFRSWHREEERGSSWGARRLGYLPEPMIGYALALTAIAKNDPRPAWREHLAYGIRSPFDKGLKCLLYEREKMLGSLLG